MERLSAKRALYPLMSVFTGIVVLVAGLILAKREYGMIYLGGVWLLLLLFGYYKACLAVIPFAAVTAGIFCAVTYALSRDVQSTLSAAARILAVCVAVIAGMGIRPSALISNLSTLRAPRSITLGMMIAVGFFPLLMRETKQIREAMRTRGAGSMLRPIVFYRAFLLPLVIRLVNISDTLSLSVETRGFSIGDKNYTVYKKTVFGIKDGVFAVIFTLGTVLAVIFL